MICEIRLSVGRAGGNETLVPSSTAIDRSARISRTRRHRARRCFQRDVLRLRWPMTDDELRQVAADLIKLKIRDYDTRQASLGQLADAVVVRRGNAAGFVIPALVGWGDDHLEAALQPTYRFKRIIVAGSRDRLDEELAFA